MVGVFVLTIDVGSFLYKTCSFRDMCVLVGVVKHTQRVKAHHERPGWGPNHGFAL